MKFPSKQVLPDPRLCLQAYYFVCYSVKYTYIRSRGTPSRYQTVMWYSRVGVHQCVEVGKCMQKLPTSHIG